METKWKDVERWFLYEEKNQVSIYQVLAWLKTDKSRWESGSEEQNFLELLLTGCAEKIAGNPIFVPDHKKILNQCDTGFTNQSTEIQHEVMLFCIFSV